MDTCIVDENIMMMFSYTLKGTTVQWFDQDLPRCICSILYFIEVFYRAYGCEQFLDTLYGRNFQLELDLQRRKICEYFV